MIKRKLAVSLVALLALAVTACGKSAPAPGEAPSTGPATNPPAVAGGGGTTTGGTTAPGGGTAPAGTNTNPGTPAAAPPTYEKVKLGPLKTGDTAKVGPLEVTVSEMAAIRQTTGLPAGYAYVLLNITVKNNGNTAYTINNAEHFKMTSPDGKPRSLNMQAMGQRTPSLGGTLEKGQSKAGWLGYMPKMDVAGKFIYLYTHPDYGDATWEFSVN